MARFIFLVIVLWCGTADGQNVTYAREVISYLCDSSLHGRSAEFNGERKAAEFIAGEFNKIGLEQFNNSYFQEFIVDELNTFPGKMEVTAGGKKLLPGKDFVLTPTSGSLNGTFELVWFDKQVINDEKRYKKLQNTGLGDKIIVADKEGIEDKGQLKLFDSMNFNPLRAKGVIILENGRLNHGRRLDDRHPYPVLHVKKDALSRSAKAISFDLESVKESNYRSQNVIGYIPGTQSPDTYFVFSAHYDHLGRMGRQTYFPGASDNASGTAMLLDLAKYFTKNTPKISVVFIAFGGEELYLVGSKYFTENPLVPLENIKFVMNMDIMGTGDQGIKVVNANLHPEFHQRLKDINDSKGYLANIGGRGQTSNSDHYHFTQKNVPAFFIYTLGEAPGYHDVFDTPDTINLAGYVNVFNLLIDYFKTFE